jgi:hypothetical protein
MTEEHKDKFIIIPIIYAKKEFSLEEQYLLGIIYGLSQERGYCYASNEYLTLNYPISNFFIKKYLKQLENKNIIKRTITKKDKNQWKTERRIFLNYQDSTLSTPSDFDPPTPSDFDTLEQGKNRPIDSIDYNKDNNKDNNKDIPISDEKINYHHFEYAPNVKLSREKAKEIIVKKYNNDVELFKYGMEILSDYIEAKPKKYKNTEKSHAQVLRGWVFKEAVKQKQADIQHLKMIGRLK